MVSHTQPMAFTAAADCDLSREDSLRRWLALHTEPPLEPELPFVDCHHHLMDHREPKGNLQPKAAVSSSNKKGITVRQRAGKVRGKKPIQQLYQDHNSSPAQEQPAAELHNNEHDQ